MRTSSWTKYAEGQPFQDYVLRLLLTAGLLLLTVISNGQQTEGWEELYDRYYSLDPDDEEDEAEREEDMERLRLMADHPLNINQATREDLELLPFLSDRQIEGILEYRDRYGPLRSLGELRMISAMDYQQTLLLPFFIYIDPDEQKASAQPSMGDLLRDRKSVV